MLVSLPLPAAPTPLWNQSTALIVAILWCVEKGRKDSMKSFKGRSWILSRAFLIGSMGKCRLDNPS